MMHAVSCSSQADWLGDPLYMVWSRFRLIITMALTQKLHTIRVGSSRMNQWTKRKISLL